LDIPVVWVQVPSFVAPVHRMAFQCIAAVEFRYTAVVGAGRIVLEFLLYIVRIDKTGPLLPAPAACRMSACLC